MYGSGKENAADIETAEEGVQFVNMTISPDGTYEIYQAPTAADARCFLERKVILQKYTFIVVETPEGKWGKDIDGLYLEKLLPIQLNITEAQYDGSIIGIPSILSFGMAAKGVTDNFLVNAKCGNCSHCWMDGIRYRNKTLVRCPECKSLNLVDSSRLSYFI